MKCLALIVFTGTFFLLSGCGDDGVVLGGSGGQTVHSWPIPHYALPSDNAAGFVDTALIMGTPVELGAGNDLWALWFDDGQSTGNGGTVNDWEEALTTDLNAAVPNPTTPTASWPGRVVVQSWVLSIVNQHFFRDVDGSALAGTITYEGLDFTSHPISIVDENGQATAGLMTAGSPYAAGEQNQLIDSAGVIGTGNNGYPQVKGPMSSIVNFAYNGGTGNPGGSITGVCFVEAFGVNSHIESNVGRVTTVPNPNSAGAPIVNTDAGILVKRFVDNWSQVALTNAGIDKYDGALFSYYLAAVAAHAIGNGVGLGNSAFTLPIGIVSNQDNIMSRTVVLDMSALIVAGKQFQFVSPDHFTLTSTLPGQFR